MDMENLDTISEDLLHKSQGYAEIAQEYYWLSLQSCLTQAQETRLSEILQQAESDRLLSFIIDETDHILGHELDLIDLSKIREQQDRLRRALDNSWVDQVMQDSRDRQAARVPKQSLEQAQARLKQEGFYTGEIDGHYGPEMQQAFDSLRQVLTQELKRRGLYDGPTDAVETRALRDMLRQVKETERGTDMETKVDLLGLESWLDD
ncbi:MAG: peptidoglycan-binding protein [Elainellaceae cyanobacterium]